MPTATEARAVDPTRTAVLRRRYAQHYRAMWRRINRAINEYIDGVDFSQPLPLRMIAFNRFVDTLLQREFGQAENDRERGVRAMALAAYMRGITQANAEVEDDMPPAQQAIYQPEHDNAIGALILLLSTQLMGVRTSLAGQLLQRYQQANGANDAKVSLSDRIQKAGRTPTDTLAGDGIVRGYNDALLNAYEAAGVNFVGAVPEQKSFWQTMEDDFVCSYCHQMSQEKDNGYGPGIYTIAQARGLIPAHPRCRCRWRAMPKDFERSQGYTATATSPKWGTWRAPKEIGSDPRLWLYRGGGRKPVKKDDT